MDLSYGLSLFLAGLRITGADSHCVAVCAAAGECGVNVVNVVLGVLLVPLRRLDTWIKGNVR